MKVFQVKKVSMISGSDICIVIPTYNAEETIEGVLSSIPDFIDLIRLSDEEIDKYVGAALQA